MNKLIIGLLMLCCAATWADSPAKKPNNAGKRPEEAMLPPSSYRVPLDEVIVRGQAPYWQSEAPPRWDKPKVDVPQQNAPSRLQWAPHYSRDERDDYNGTRDQLNPQPRTKIFELHF